ncbi:nicotinamide N-methyltransferase-like [Lissotriton helveticus]
MLRIHRTGRESFRVTAYQQFPSQTMEPSLTWTSQYQKYFDSEKGVTEYHTAESEFTDDSVIQPMRQLEQFFASGSVKGDTLVLYGFATNIHLLFPACAYFKEITIMDFLDTGLQYVENWLKNHPKAFDWTQCFKSIQGDEDQREKWIANEEKLRKAITIKNIIKLELSESGPVAPKSFPLVDCLLSPYALAVVCKDKACFISTLKNMSCLLKVGGHLILFLFIQCTYAYIGGFKLPVLCIEDDFVKNVLNEQGFVIKEARLNPRINQTKISVMDFSHILFLVALKVKNLK